MFDRARPGFGAVTGMSRAVVLVLLGVGRLCGRFETPHRRTRHRHLHRQQPRTAEALNSLAQTYQALGYTHHAIQRHNQALDTATTTGISYEQARAHTGLGDAHTALNDHDQAHTHWQQALDIYRRLDVPEATEVQARLP